jgi:hypothetical protein
MIENNDCTEVLLEIAWLTTNIPREPVKPGSVSRKCSAFSGPQKEGVTIEIQDNLVYTDLL